MNFRHIEIGVMSLIMSFLTISCQQEVQKEEPPSMTKAKSAALNYAETNGIKNLMVRDAYLSRGKWVLVLTGKHDHIISTAIVSPEGNVESFSIPR